MPIWPLFLSNTTQLHNIMLIFRKDNHYSAAPQATLQLDNKPVDAKQVEVLFDSGSSYTHLPPGLYELLISAVRTFQLATYSGLMPHIHYIYIDGVI
jgi:hypothetical protein